MGLYYVLSVHREAERSRYRFEVKAEPHGPAFAGPWHGEQALAAELEVTVTVLREIVDGKPERR